MNIAPTDPIYCAIDTDDLDKARALSKSLAAVNCCIKLGLQFFNAHGPQGVKIIRDAHPDLSIFLDLKYHDIPNTVAQAVKAAVPLQVQYINVHASGGTEMMRAAKKAAIDEADRLGVKAPKVLAVTILTSLSDENLDEIGYRGNSAQQVVQLAKLTQDAGLDGIVCSPHEITQVRQVCRDDFILMVPGIRPQSHESGSDDQKRIMSPAQAINAGASHLVIGRPITQSDDPAQAAQDILKQICR